jgi:uncharacterized membrane protein YdfJ with MMPL/SSD domain
MQLAGKALLGLLAVVLLSRISPLFWALLALWVWWVIGALTSQGRRVAVVIHAKDARSSPVAISSQAKTGRFSGYYEVFDLPARPGLDAEQMTAELGALIKDIQNNVGSARARWTSPALAKHSPEGELPMASQRLPHAQPEVVGPEAD